MIPVDGSFGFSAGSQVAVQVSGQGSECQKLLHLQMHAVKAADHRSHRLLHDLVWKGSLSQKAESLKESQLAESQSVESQLLESQSAESQLVLFNAKPSMASHDSPCAANVTLLTLPRVLSPEDEIYIKDADEFTLKSKTYSVEPAKTDADSDLPSRPLLWNPPRVLVTRGNSLAIGTAKVRSTEPSIPLDNLVDVVSDTEPLVKPELLSDISPHFLKNHLITSTKKWTRYANLVGLYFVIGSQELYIAPEVNETQPRVLRSELPKFDCDRYETVMSDIWLSEKTPFQATRAIACVRNFRLFVEVYDFATNKVRDLRF